MTAGAPGPTQFSIALPYRAAGRPGFLQALAHAALFYLTVGATGSLVLLVALFNRRKRTLHDLLAGTLMVRAVPIFPDAVR